MQMSSITQQNGCRRPHPIAPSHMTKIQYEWSTHACLAQVANGGGGEALLVDTLGRVNHHYVSRVAYHEVMRGCCVAWPVMYV